MGISSGDRRAGGLRFGLASLLLVLAMAALPSSAGAVASIFDSQAGLPDLDTRDGRLAPNAAQRQVVTELGAEASWNRFGTPQSLIAYGGYLGDRPSGDAADAARAWVRAHRDLFRLSDADVSALRLLSDSPLRGTAGHAVIFNQRFGALDAAQDGMITVAINDEGVFYVSSSAAGSQSAPQSATLSPTQAWRRAAANAGLDATGAISNLRQRDGWTQFTVSGLATPLVPETKQRVDQRARLVAFPTYTGGVRAAYETIVLDNAGGNARAYKSFVDARTGATLLRQNAVEQLADADSNGSFSGNTGGADACGPQHPIQVDDGTYSVDVVASANNPADDIVLQLLDPDGDSVASADTATSPEAIHYSDPDGNTIASGAYAAQVCQFDPAAAAFDYTGAYATNSIAPTPTNPSPDPEWKYFTANPPLDLADADTRIVGCWVLQDGLEPPCDREEQNLASRVPWDTEVGTGPTFTTQGNNARTAEAWTSPLTPGPFGYMPTSIDRKYAYEWSDAWQNSSCDPANLIPGTGNDIKASVANLFTGHNRFHDFSYFLGFTEDNFNLQSSNFNSIGGRAGDPELGDVQAGALTGGAPTYEGRDNANQITLNDGIPGITNQYLFQPIAGAFYAPCVDGDYDTSVYGHEYTHAISNRMVGGPDSGLSGFQARAMGESWSDLDALEYLHAFGYVPTGDENDWAEGPYVTGNKEVGIRDYALDDSPLNLSDIGFDVTGPEVHADGEIWNAVNYDLRQALVDKYDSEFPSGDANLQARCAEGELPVESCPGNRRWIQIVYDAFLLQQPATSMLDARDAYLAADVNRFGGDNQASIWDAFAKRGFGHQASTASTEDDQPRPAFDSPFASEGQVTFAPRDAGAGTPVDASVYIGDYEARVTPIADTDPATARPATASFVAGTYDVLVQADGYGLRRFTLRVAAGETRTRSFSLAPNWASSSQGASASGSGAQQDKLIDDTEATQWSANPPANVDVTRPAVTVDLGGGARQVRSVQVSAMLSPGQNRFTALRRFAIQTCKQSAARSCAGPADFHTIYRSPGDAFPGSRPRPVAPDLITRAFDVPDTSATHVRIVALENQCTGGPDFAGEQDNDPTNSTDCSTASSRGQELHAAELEVFSARVR